MKKNMAHTPYDKSNIFAKIISGDIPCHKVYEDKRTLVFMDIMPREKGHLLVIPKVPARNLLDISQDDLQNLILIVQKTAQAAQKAFSADGITLMQFSEEAGGQEVFHLHFHVIPRFAGRLIKPPGQPKAPDDVLDQHALLVSEAFEDVRSKA